MNKKLILASSSKYRKAMLNRLFNDVECIAPTIDERATSAESPQALSRELGLLKANNVAQTLTENDTPSLIIGSDQVAVLGEQILHKPGNAEKNIEQLKACSGKTVNFYTSVCVLNSETLQSDCEVDTTIVQFRTLSQNEIEEYVAREPAQDCAGGFKVEGLGISLFESVESSDPNALVGLPLIELNRLLRSHGVNCLK